jgi:hypothetical protein
MPALDGLGADPCSLLNTTTFPKLWISDTNAANTSSDTTIFPLIATSGTPISYLSALANSNTGTILSSGSINPNSQFSLLQFLSGGGITSVANGGADFSLLKNVVLSQGSKPETIVDSYIVQAMRKNYTFSTTENPILKPTDFWNPSDATPTGSIVSAPSSLLGMLLAKGYLLQQIELFNPSEFTPNAPPPASGTESLIYLYQLSLKPGYTLTTQQAARILTLEAKNLRFFGAFLAEYCYYRTRYEWLLQKYFYVYTTPVDTYSPIGAGSPVFAIFNGQGAGDNQYSATPLAQSEYLKGIAYQMACLNTRMIDLRYLLGQISGYYTGVLGQIQQTVNNSTLPGSNTDLTKKILALNTSAEQAQKYMTETEFQQGAMEYNSEKNRYANVLLSLYAFLNIAAVAMIVQLSRS